ncbi:MAG: type II toxin-antitoxin system HigB family toxin [Gammaproteobacteria bacterium]|nr:type II toxin-antitoxin system HigB family toxin [Gammaproteobacteria bacterium]
MHLISNRMLLDFAFAYPDAHLPLQAWRRLIECTAFHSFADLRAAFNSVDRVKNFYVFNIGGNKYRVVAAIHFNRQKLYVRHVFTHSQYDHWRPDDANSQRSH